MAMDDNEEPLIGMRDAQNLIKALWQRFAVRFVLLLGVVAFIVAVGIDSFQHQASAAAIRSTTLEISAFSSAPSSLPDELSLVTEASEDTYLEFDVKTAERLGHSDMVGASLTRSRLTHAHLFTRRVPN